MIGQLNYLTSKDFLQMKFCIRYSTVTDSTTVSSRYHGRNRPRRRKHRLPSALDRVIFILLLFILFSLI